MLCKINSEQEIRYMRNASRMQIFTHLASLISHMIYRMKPPSPEPHAKLVPPVPCPIFDAASALLNLRPPPGPTLPPRIPMGLVIRLSNPDSPSSFASLTSEPRLRREWSSSFRGSSLSESADSSSDEESSSVLENPSISTRYQTGIAPMMAMKPRRM